MNVLLIHQGFPSQYLYICQELIRREGNTVVSIGMGNSPFKNTKNYRHYQYQPTRGNSTTTHPWAIDVETKSIRAEACGNICQKLKSQGFMPDIICGHPGWGELLGVPHIWPETPILMYQEYYYNAYGFDCNFDPEFQKDQNSWEDKTRIEFKNANTLLNLKQATWNVTPTKFQRDSFPDHYHDRFAVIHDGISNQARPSKERNSISIEVSDEIVLKEEDQLITFVNRTVEPYRGCHSFIRSIPYLQEKNPNSTIVIVGNTQGTSYGKRCQEGEWKDVFLKEIKGQYNCQKVIFTGTLDYQKFLNLLKISRVHVYLTYPFVLSWSLLEAMSTGCSIVASSTAPVCEVIKHRESGLLVDFFNPKAIAESISELLNDRELAAKLGTNASEFAIENFSLERCLPRQLELINLVASRAIGS